MSLTIPAFTVAPQCDFKAAREQEQHGIETILLTEQREIRRRDKVIQREDPLLRGYLFTGYKTAFSKHVKRRVGDVERSEIDRIRRGHTKPPAHINKFDIGDVVVVVGDTADIPGKVVEVCGYGTYRVEFVMCGKPHTSARHEIHLRKYDPG